MITGNAQSTGAEKNFQVWNVIVRVATVSGNGDFPTLAVSTLLVVFTGTGTAPVKLMKKAK